MQFQMQVNKTSVESELDDRVREFFTVVAGEDMEVDWMELKNVLDFAINKGDQTAFI